MRRLCPTCVNRRSHLVAPECVVCEGIGCLLLGEGALSLYGPEVVSQAVLLGLEAKARVADTTLTLSDDRAAAVREGIKELTTAGLLAPITKAPHLVKSPPPAPKRKRDALGQYALESDPSALAARSVQIELFPLDLVLANAERFEYQQHERPNARGLPVLSANGHPSHLSRVTDPMEPGTNTRADVFQRKADDRSAHVLALAAPEAVRMKERKAQRQAIAV